MFFIIIAALIFGADTLMKQYIDTEKELGKEEEIAGGKIIVTKCYNSGAMLNFMQNQKEKLLVITSILFGGVSALFVFALPKKGGFFYKLGLAFAVGGAGSNFLDRLRKGYVVDYFSLSKYKKIVFNIGDLFVFLGSFFILLTGWRQK